MLFRTIAGLALIMLAGVSVGQVFPTLYAIPLSISLCLLLSYPTCIWIMEGTKQTFVEFVFLLPPCIVPVRVRIWAIFNDKELK